MKTDKTVDSKTGWAGFSLVEIIIVLAVMGLLAGGSVSMLSYIHLANTKRCAEDLNTLLEKTKLKTMSSAGKESLFIYRKADGVYAVIAEGPWSLTLAGQGSRIGGADIKITAYTGGAPTEIEETTGTGAGVALEISFKRSTGEFVSAYDTLEIAGKTTMQIVLVKNTGKHYIAS